MKKNFPMFLCLFLLITLIFTACTKPDTSLQENQNQSLTDTSVPTENPTVSVTVVPTAEPEPIPCTLAFDTNRDNNWEIYSMASDGSNQVNLSNNAADDFDPAWSPEGSQIAFVSNRENDVPGQYIYVMNADGSNVFQLTLENGSDFPDWSHDGSTITYTSNGDIFIIKADGSGQSVNLTNSPEIEHRSSWSPDGSKIVFTLGEDQNQNIYVMNPDGSNKTQVTDNGQNYLAQWTIDNRIFTGWGWKDQDQFCNNCVVNPDGTGIMDAGGKGMLRRYFPYWTEEGERVECASVAFNDSPTADIYLIGGIFTDGLLNLTNSEADERNVNWPANCGQPSMVIGLVDNETTDQSRGNNFRQACDEQAIFCPSGNMTDLVEQGVDAIVLNSVNGTPLEDLATIQATVDAGIPVFLLDAEIDMQGLYSVTVDQAKWVETSLEWMFEKIGGDGQFVYFDLYPAFSHLDAINEILSRYPEISVVDHPDTVDDPLRSKPVTADLLKTNPEIKAIWTNGYYSPIIQGVVEESGLTPDQWPLMMCEPSSDGLYYWNEKLKQNSNFDCIIVGNPSGIAYDAFYAAYYLLSGKEIDPSVLGGKYGRSLLVDFPVVTSDNLQEYIETNSNLNQFMSPEEILEQWFIN